MCCASRLACCQVMAHLREVVGGDALLAAYNAAREHVRTTRTSRKKNRVMQVRGGLWGYLIHVCVCVCVCVCVRVHVCACVLPSRHTTLACCTLTCYTLARYTMLFLTHSSRI